MKILSQNYLQNDMSNQLPNHYLMEADIMRPYTRTYATVNLDALKYNLNAMKTRLSRETGIIGVVKADAYGHGAVPVAKAMEEQVCGYAVAAMEEAIQLRRHGVTKPVIILGVTHETHNREIIEYGIRPAIFTLEQAKKLSETAVTMEKSAIVHLAVDTGMSRIGMTPDEKSADMIKEMKNLPSLQLEGIFTHFAKADEQDKTSAARQLEQFNGFIGMLNERDIQIPVKHCSNSAAIIDMADADMDAVRAGISMYGLYPSGDVIMANVPLVPILEWKSFITYVKKIPEGTPVSYGGTYVAEKEITVATIPVGYGDGYPRYLSNKGSILVHGKRARILGRVCMDQMMVDVTDIPEAKVDDEVTLIGIEEKDQITVMEMAGTGGGFHYEILCDINKRVPRVYLKAGRIYGKKDYFNDRYEDPC